MSFVTSAPASRGIAGRIFGPIISLPALKNHSATVIMLHGLVRIYLMHLLPVFLASQLPFSELMRSPPRRRRHSQGDTGNGWAPVAPELGLNHIKW